MTKLPLRFLVVGLFFLYQQTSNAQNHDLDFKVRELTHGTGANIQNVKVDIDNGSYMSFTDANGVAHIHNVTDGTHRIQVSKSGYIEFLQDGYVLSSNQTFNASMINNTQTGAWGTVNFNLSWWRQTFGYVGTTMWNQDNPQWKQIAPVFNRISSVPAYTQADSLGIVAAINEIESKTGYNLITLVPNTASPDTTYTINTHSSNGSQLEFDENFIISKGHSGISVTSPTKRVIHEIVTQFGMKPINHLAYPSVMEPSVTDVIDMQPWDANNIAVTFNQHYAKQRGEQDLFLGNMLEYIIPITPGATTNTLPVDNTTGLDNMVRVMWDNVAGTDKYHVDIATDNLFNNIVQDLMVYRSDTTITLNPNQQYFMRIQDINTAGSSAWSSTTTFKTAGLTVGNTSFTSPTIGAVDVNTPIHVIYTPSINSTQYNLEASLTDTFAVLVKDTILFNTTADIPASRHTKYFFRIRGENPSQGTFGQWSSTIDATTINNFPTTPVTNIPVNGATLIAANYASGQLILKYTTTAKDIDNDNITTTFIVTGPGVNKTFITTTGGQVTQTIDSLLFQPNQNYTTTIKADDGYGGVSNGASTTFKTQPLTPGNTGFTTPVNGAVNVNTPIHVIYTPSINATQYNLEASLVNTFATLVKDTILFNTTADIPASRHTKYYFRIRGENPGQGTIGPWSSTINFTTIDIITRIVEIEAKTSFYAYPNPFNDYITLKTSDTKSTSFKIALFTAKGSLIRSLKIPSDEKINLSDIKAGSYLIRILFPDNSEPLRTIKIIKQ